MSEHETVRIIRIFVSSPGDLQGEREVLDEVVARINRTDDPTRKVRLAVWKWEVDTVPQIGPGPQPVVDQQMPSHYDIYLGIMKHRFGTPTSRYGSGTEEEFNEALERWGNLGSPWILFYFDKARVNLDELDLEQVAKVRQFKQKLKSIRALCDLRGSPGNEG